jgi:choline dehydrogenase-like flavoprotein
MPERFDVIIVGGGTAGCVLAARLSEEPERTVCLVEAGPDYGPYAEGRWPADMLDARNLPMSHLWENEPDDRSASRARILGGCSAHNACLVVWGSRDDYDEWGDGWTFAEFEPYLRRAEAAISTRTDRSDELSPFHRALLEAGPRIGLPRLADLNDLDATVGIAPAPVNALGAVRWNTAFAYLDDARSRPNLTIAPETLVDRVEIAGGRAVGIASDSGRLTADTVILAAGAYGSPALLLRSGIGPPSQLNRLGIGAIEDLPVGVDLADHPGVGLEWVPAAAHVPEEGLVFATSLLVRARSDSCPEGTWDLLFLPWLDEADEGWQTTAVVYLLKPDSRGSVTLRSPDPRVPPVINHGFLFEPHDVDRLASGVALIRTLAKEAGCGREVRPGNHEQLDTYLRREVRGIFHPTGTCAIGAVVDTRGAVLGVDGLVVADASIMPTIPPREYEPQHHRRRRADLRLASRLSRSRWPVLTR